MTSTKGPIRGVRISDGRYYLVKAIGKKRVWVPLSRVSAGMPELLATMGEAIKEPVVADDKMPRVITEWQKLVMVKHAATTQRDEKARGAVIGRVFQDFTAAELQPPDVSAFLEQFKDKPKTFNFYRAQIAELMRFAIEKGWRAPGTNPVTGVIRTMTTRARDRYPTDSEIRRIKVAGIYSTRKRDLLPGTPRLKNPSGLMLAALIDMAYLTGQRISDLLQLKWSALGPDGIVFAPSKISKSTGLKVLIQWTPKLRDVERRLKELRASRRAFGDWVFTKIASKKGAAKAAQRYTYSGAHSAYRRACDRAGIENLKFNDLRAKALTDTEESEGMQAARRKGLHSTEQQTSDYVRHRKPQKSKATR